MESSGGFLSHENLSELLEEDQLDQILTVLSTDHITQLQGLLYSNTISYRRLRYETTRWVYKNRGFYHDPFDLDGTEREWESLILNGCKGKLKIYIEFQRPKFAKAYESQLFDEVAQTIIRNLFNEGERLDLKWAENGNVRHMRKIGTLLCTFKANVDPLENCIEIVAQITIVVAALSGLILSLTGNNISSSAMASRYNPQPDLSIQYSYD